MLSARSPCPAVPTRREPAATEKERLLKFMKEQPDAKTGREQWGRVIFNLNEFVYAE